MERLTFSTEQFNSLFPFHFLMKENGQVCSTGDGLHKLLKINCPQPFSETFVLERPQPGETFTLSSLVNQAVIIRSVTHPGIRLRGQFEPTAGDHLLFVGAPWFHSVDEVIHHNLSFSDFAHHDPTIDMLHIMKSQDIANAEIKTLLDKINNQKNLNPKAVEIGKKLLPEARWICGNAFDQELWEDITKDLPDNRFDFMVSNPPFGKDMNKRKADWLNMTSERDLMVLELCLKYAKGGYFIVPQGSCPFTYSGHPYYEDKPDRWSMKFKRFVKATKDHYKFNLTCDGIDTSIYKGEWKGLNSMTVEAMDVQIWPYTLDYEQDALSFKYANVT